MSFWDIALPVATTGLGFALGGPMGAAAGAALGGGIETNMTNANSVAQTNATNIALAQQNNAFQQEMSSTAYTRMAQDMRNAGLNPIAGISSGGASAPSGNVAPQTAFQAVNPISPALTSAVQAISAINDSQKTAADTRLTNAQANLAENYEPDIKAGQYGLLKEQAIQAGKAGSLSESQIQLNRAELPLEQAKGTLGTVVRDSTDSIVNQVRKMWNNFQMNSGKSLLDLNTPAGSSPEY